jgi:elongation factor Ts
MAKNDLNLIQQLRNMTGMGMLDCKKALDANDGDIDKAVDFLRKKGAAVAGKRSGNTTSEGIIHAYIHPGSRIGVLLELDCETDFVANTAEFVQAAKDICLHIVASKPLYLTPEQVDPTFLEHERSIMLAQMEGSGKPEKILNQIIDGKVSKLYADICLMKQTFVKDDQFTIEQVIENLMAKLGENIKIKRFVRFEIGA